MVTVAGLSSDGLTVYLSSTLQYQHYGWVGTACLPAFLPACLPLSLLASACRPAP